MDEVMVKPVTVGDTESGKADNGWVRGQVIYINHRHNWALVEFRMGKGIFREGFYLGEIRRCEA